MSEDNFTPHPDYNNLPEGIKSSISPKEYAWMPDDLRKDLQKDMTLPEVGED